MIKKLMFLRGFQIEVILESNNTYTVRQDSKVIGVAETYEEALIKYEEARQDIFKQLEQGDNK